MRRIADGSETWVVAALWTTTTAVAEATVVTSAAQAGSTQVFDTW